MSCAATCQYRRPADLCRFTFGSAAKCCAPLAPKASTATTCPLSSTSRTVASLPSSAKAGYIKPWKDSSAGERLDPRNGLAACPSHDVAFDTGMLTVTADLKIHVAQPLADAAPGDHLTRQYYGRPPLLDTLLLPDNAERPRRRYLDWHREKIFVA
jgi:predicted restriction endonuclease